MHCVVALDNPMRRTLFLSLSLLFLAACNTHNENQLRVSLTKLSTNTALSDSSVTSTQTATPSLTSTPQPTATAEPTPTVRPTPSLTATRRPTRTVNPTATIPFDSLRAITPEAPLAGVTTPEELANAGLHTFAFECNAFNDCGCPNTDQFVYTITFDDHSVTISNEVMISWTYDEIGMNLYYTRVDDNEAFILFELDGHRSEFWNNGELCSIQNHKLR